MNDQPTNLPATTTRAPLVAGGSPVAIVAHTMEEAYRLATAVAKSGFAPRGMESAEACMVAIMMGAELGLTPMASVQRIANINGRPTIGGELGLALVETRGLAEYVKEWIEGDGDQMVAYCETKRKGRARIVKAEFSVADAVRAGLWDTRTHVKRWIKNKSSGQWEQKEVRNDSPWFRYPKRMLQMRARGFCLRDAYPDVLMGLYLREELEDGYEEEPQPTQAVALEPPNPDAPEEKPEPIHVPLSKQGQGRHDEQQQEGGEAQQSSDTPVQDPASVADSEAGDDDALLPLDDPGDKAAEWITFFPHADTGQDLRDYATDEAIFERIAAGDFDEATAAAINRAYNAAIDALQPPQEMESPESPDPNA